VGPQAAGVKSAQGWRFRRILSFNGGSWRLSDNSFPLPSREGIKGRGE